MEFQQLRDEIASADEQLAKIDEGLVVLAPSVAKTLVSEIQTERSSGKWALFCLAIQMPNGQPRLVPIWDKRNSPVVDNLPEVESFIILAVEQACLPVGFVAVAKDDIGKFHVQNRVIKEFANAVTRDWLDRVGGMFQKVHFDIDRADQAYSKWVN